MLPSCFLTANLATKVFGSFGSWVFYLRRLKPFRTLVYFPPSRSLLLQLLERVRSPVESGVARVTSRLPRSVEWVLDVGTDQTGMQNGKEKIEV